MSVRTVFNRLIDVLDPLHRGLADVGATEPVLRLPRHLAVIMDGNGRWAVERGLPRVAGHRAGVEAVKRLVRACLEWGIPYLTVYAFSTENWKRPQDEINALMALLAEYLQKEIDELARNGVCVRAIGRIDELPAFERSEIRRAEALTAHNRRLILNIGLNYGGRSEIVDAVRAVAEKVERGELSADQITEETISQQMYTAGQPDPDLLIRTGGDERLSNFLLWQVAYAELYVTPVYWPDFTPEQLRAALLDFQSRDRRFGGLPAARKG